MILHLFTLLFVGLKLGHVINWSWLAVLSPSIAVLVIVFLVALVAAARE